MRGLRIGAYGVFHDALHRLEGFGVRVLTRDPVPNFPEAFKPHLTLDFGGLGDEIHDCPKERTVVLVGVVVLDVVVLANCGSQYTSTKPFRPYIVPEMILLHDNMRRPGSEWRELHGAEAVCAMALNPWLHSVGFRSHLGPAEAYIHHGKVVVGYAKNEHHHTAYVPKIITPDFACYAEGSKRS